MYIEYKKRKEIQTVLEEFVKNLENKDGYVFLYIHQGGVLGNKTMIERYKFKFSNFLESI